MPPTDKGAAVFDWIARQPAITEPPPLIPTREEKWISPEAIDKVLGAFESGPMTVAQVMEATGYSSSHVGMVVRYFVVEGDLVMVKRKLPRVYALPCDVKGI